MDGPQQPSDPTPPATECLPWCPICRGAAAFTGERGDDLRVQVGELQREAALTARAVIDHYLSSAPAAEPEVEEIPID